MRYLDSIVAVPEERILHRGRLHRSIFLRPSAFRGSSSCRACGGQPARRWWPRVRSLLARPAWPRETFATD